MPYKFTPSTGTLELTGAWGPKNFNKLITSLGISAIRQLIVKDGCALSMHCVSLSNIQVERLGNMFASCSMLYDINTEGVVRVRNTTITDVVNDGQLYMTGYSRCRTLNNKRHVNMSQSSMCWMECGDHASVKATSSYIVESRATASASLHLGPSKVIRGAGSLRNWSVPGPGDKGFNAYVPSMQCYITALTILAQIDKIDSTFVYPANGILLKYVVDLANYLANHVELPYDIAKEVAGRIVFPDKYKKGKRNVSVDVVGAKDELLASVGFHAPAIPRIPRN